jgi:hypothetical protein
MSQKEQIETHNTASKLERFVLGFEYDKTLQQLKREVRIRTL